MALSIFNKPGGGLSETATVGRPVEGATPASAWRPGAAGGATVSDMQIDVRALPLSQQAAVLYAGGYGDAALQLLRVAVRDNLSDEGTRPWLMLLDLHQIRGEQREFEELAMKYAVKFEHSPPVWNAQFAHADNRRRETRTISDYFALQPRDKAPLAQQLIKLEEFAHSREGIRIDLARLLELDSDEARLLAASIGRLRRDKVPLRLSNLDPLLASLRQAASAEASAGKQGSWLLLFESFQVLGKHAEFEDLGVEYAVAFEVSPPAWQAAVAPKPEQEAQAETQSPAGRQFQLRGEVTLATRDQIQQMMNFGAAQPEVAVNMAATLRIDFQAVGLVAEAIAALHHAQKAITLLDVNEMVRPLLEAFGINQMAAMPRAKAI